MKKSNFLILGIAAVAAALLLFLWYYLGLNAVDEPFDLVLAVCWWVGIVAIAAVIVKLEANRKRQIRTIYVSPTALYNSESGVVGLKDAENVAVMQDILNGLEYGFDKKAMPETSKFDYRFVVQTDEYKPASDQDEEGSQPKWTGKVVKIDRENGNVETQFEDEQQLREALAA